MVDIRRSSVEVIRVGLSEFRGRSYVHIRHWVESDRLGEYIPTKRGVTLQPDQVRELIDALQEIANAAPGAEAGPE